MNIIFNLKFYCVVFFLLFIGCSNQDSVNNIEIFDRAGPGDSLSFYFPAILNDTVVKHPRYKNFEQNWFSSALYSLKEPILYKKNNFETIYRFLWLRSFHEPVSFSLKKYKEDYYLNTKMLDKQPAFYSNITSNVRNGKEVLDTLEKADRFANIIIDKVRKLKKNKWDLFETYLEEQNFWRLNSLVKSNGTEPTDGSVWILEGYKNKSYHFIIRRGGEGFRKCGEYLIKLSELNLPEDVIY